MAKAVIMSIRKLLMIVLVIIVSILVIMAFYSNRGKFSGLDTIKYMKVNISNATSISELAEKYADSDTKEKFVTELKRVNEISSQEYINKRTVFIPVYNSN